MGRIDFVSDKIQYVKELWPHIKGTWGKIDGIPSVSTGIIVINFAAREIFSQSNLCCIDRDQSLCDNALKF